MLGHGPISSSAISELPQFAVLNTTAFDDAVAAAVRGLDGPTFLVRLMVTDVFGAVQEIDGSDVGYTTPPTGSLPNVDFEGRATQPLNFSWTIPVLPEGDRRVGLETVNIDLVNIDGQYDLNVFFTSFIIGRGVQVLYGLNSYPFDWFTPVFTGAGVSWLGGTKTLSIVARDRSYILDKPLQLSVYGGTGGADGTADNLAQPKPLCFGIVRNIRPVAIDPTHLIYQFHSRAVQSVDAVYDKGAPLTFSANYADYTALAAAAVAPGFYATSVASGMLRLGSAPAGTVTADVHGDNASSFAISTAAVARRLLQYAMDTAAVAVNASDVNDASFSAFDAAVPGNIGWYQDAATAITVHDAMNAVIGHCGGWWGVDPASGMFVVGYLPASISSGIIYDNLTDGDILDVEMIDAPGEGNPRWRQNYGYRPNWTVQQPTDLAGTVSAADVVRLGQAYQSKSRTNTAILRAFPLALDSPVLETLFDDEADATAVATSWLNLLGQTQRRAFKVSIDLRGLTTLRLARGSLVQITLQRLNLAFPRNWILIGAEVDAGAHKVWLIFWG